MKIDYKALWIDDNLGEIQDLKDGIEDNLSEFGFRFDVDERKSLSDRELEELVDQLSQYNPYDLIIFDYDLGLNQKKGHEIAHELRGRIYTDMIFYSGKAAEGLRKVLFDSEVDGVFVVSRDDFIDEAWPIIEDQIKRICDINNMRGVILDEMSRVDLKLRDLFKTGYPTLGNTQQDRVVKKTREKFKESQDKFGKLKESVDRETLLSMMSDPTVVEFNILRTRLQGMYKDKEIFGEGSKLKSIQDLRNRFAHNKAEFDDVKGTVSLHGYNDEYDFEKFKNIRKDLIDIVEKLDGII